MRRIETSPANAHALSSEVGLRPAPLSNKLIKRPAESTVAVQPAQFIEEIVVNTQARDFLPQQFHYLLTKDFLQQNALMTAPPSLAHGEYRGLKTSGYWGRAIASHYGYVPLAGSHVGGMIFQKGVGPSSKVFNKPETSRTNAGEPTGFFGDSDAQNEIDWSNKLLSMGFRSSLTLGYVVLNGEKLRSYLVDQWQPINSTIANLLHTAITRVLKNGDQVTNIFRVGGVTERGLPAMEKNYHHFTRRYLNQIQAIRLWMKEGVLFPDRFKRRLPKGYSVPQALRQFEAMTHELPLSVDSSDLFFTYIASILSENQTALRIWEACQGNEHFNLVFMAKLAQGKDLDLSMLYTDYEECPLPSKWYQPKGDEHQNKPTSYLNIASTVVGNIYGLKETPFYLGKEFKEKLTSSSNLKLYPAHQIESHILSKAHEQLRSHR